MLIKNKVITKNKSFFLLKAQLNLFINFKINKKFNNLLKKNKWFILWKNKNKNIFIIKLIKFLFFFNKIIKKNKNFINLKKNINKNLYIYFINFYTFIPFYKNKIIFFPKKKKKKTLLKSPFIYKKSQETFLWNKQKISIFYFIIKKNKLIFFYNKIKNIKKIKIKNCFIFKKNINFWSFFQTKLIFIFFKYNILKRNIIFKKNKNKFCLEKRSKIYIFFKYKTIFNFYLKINKKNINFQTLKKKKKILI